MTHLRLFAFDDERIDPFHDGLLRIHKQAGTRIAVQAEGEADAASQVQGDIIVMYTYAAPGSVGAPPKEESPLRLGRPEVLPRVLDHAKRCLELGGYDIILLDNTLRGSSGDLPDYGVDVLLPIARQGSPDAMIAIITGFRMIADERTDAIRRAFTGPAQADMWLPKLSESLCDTLCSIILLVARKKQLQLQNVELRKENQQLCEMARAPYSLLARTRHLIGIDAVLLAAARVIEPFFQWKSGGYESIPLPLRRAFPTAILLEGEPGSGKTALCRAIAEALGHEAVLPKHLGPSQNPGGWKKSLEAEIRKHYSIAKERRIVVIKADDLAWPTAAEISDSAVAAEWSSYMYTVRDCIADAARINADKEPESSIVKGAASKYNGKIIWLFAKNTDKDVASMFRPLRDFLAVFQVQFPRDAQSRREIMERYAAMRECRFDDVALKLAVDSLASYKGRDLVGQDEVVRGFIPFCVSAVQDRELARFQDAVDPFEPNMVVTEDIVQAWLHGAEHLGIVADAAASDRPCQGLPQSCSHWVEPWMNMLDASVLRELCNTIWTSRGHQIENDPDTIATNYGLIYLRAVLAAFRVALRDRQDIFNEIFGFLRGKRKTVKVGRYVELKSQKTPGIFPAKPGLNSYCLRDLDADGEALRQSGFWLNLN
jgi:hypothetical protein